MGRVLHQVSDATSAAAGSTGLSKHVLLSHELVHYL